MSCTMEKMKKFHVNDVVYRFNKKKRIVFGVVTDVYELSGDDDDSFELQRGQIRVQWNNNVNDYVWNENKVSLLNRCILPGQVVRRLEKDKETQRGYCKANKMVCAVQIVGTNKVVEHVNADRLKNVNKFLPDGMVCLNDVFGEIDEVDAFLTMQSSCGSIVRVPTSINQEIDDYWLCRKKQFTLDTFYPGQEVICTPSNLFQPCWIKKSKTMQKNTKTKQRFTIQDVEIIGMSVVWHNSKKEGCTLSPEDIKKLQVVDPIWDPDIFTERRLLKLGSGDVILKKKDWLRKVSMTHRPEVIKGRPVVNCSSKTKSRVPLIRSSSLLYNSPDTSVDREEDWWTEEGEEFEEDGKTSQNSSGHTTRKCHYPPKPMELTPGHTVAVEVIYLESKVTVVWQDGIEEEDIPSTQLYLPVSLDEHEFFPGNWVLCDAPKDQCERPRGVVQHVNCLGRTAVVKFFSTDQPELDTKELSVYDLEKCGEYSFRPGVIVRSRDDGKIGIVLDCSTMLKATVRWVEDSVVEQCCPFHLERCQELSICDDTDHELSDDESSWETESVECFVGDSNCEFSLQKMASRMDFLRNRVIFLKNAFQQYNIDDNFTYLKDLMTIYENASYFDKYLDTSFFSLKSKHFLALLGQVKEKAKSLGVELKGRLFTSEDPSMSNGWVIGHKEAINKMIKLETIMNAQLEKRDSLKESDPKTDSGFPMEDNLCMELLCMIKLRLDLLNAEIVSRIGGPQALSVLTQENATVQSNLTPNPSTPEDFFDELSLVKKRSSPKAEDLISFSASLPECSEVYSVVEEAPSSHHFFNSKFHPFDLQSFLKSIQKEYKLLIDSLPDGVWVRSFENRIDLLSVMIRGPANTPYEDGLFLFDMQLTQDYPRSPPLVHYISYNSEKLNPNLYVGGKVCVSLLGTWSGRGTEVWGVNSTLLQLIVSIQGLILVSEPYFNEAGYEMQTDTQQGYENSRIYNELVILKLVQSTNQMLSNPSEVFKSEILSHFQQNGLKMCERLEQFCAGTLKPDYPLLPVSKGLKLSLNFAINECRQMIRQHCETS